MMRERHLKAALLVVVAVSTVLGGKSYIVKTHEPDALRDFASTHDISLSPLITYPDPSSEVLARFSSWFVVDTKPDSSCNPGILRTLPGIECVEPNGVHFIGFSEPLGCAAPFPRDTFHHPYTPNDPLFSDQWDKKITQTDWAWNLSTGEGVVIAILDTGADTDHEDLEANLVAGYNFVDDTPNIEDLYGHGTHVAGIAAAKMDNAKGIAGMAGGASIMPVKISANGLYTDADLAEGIIYAADRGADVVNMSVGSELPSTPVENAVEYAWDRGAVLCASAGNDAEETSAYPAAFEHVISVGASTSGDSRWSLSNYGPSVDVFAPGGGSVDILSTEFGGSYGWHSGTSMAAPQVAGLAALILSVHPEFTNLQVWDKIIQTADTLAVSHDLRINSRAALGVVALAEEKEPGLEVKCAPVQKGRIILTCRSYESGDYRLRLFDPAGREVYSKNAWMPSGGQIEYTPSLPVGVYFWELATDAGFGSGKIVYLR